MSARIIRNRQTLIAAFAIALLGGVSAGCRRILRKMTPERAQVAAAPTAPVTRPEKIEVAQAIYDGGLKPGWQDWGWGQHDLSQGPARIDLSNYGGWILYHPQLRPPYGALVFRMLPPGDAHDFLQVRLAYQKEEQAYPAVDVVSQYTRALTDGWVEVYLPWSVLNPSGAPVDHITLHAKAAIGSTPVQFDGLVLTQLSEAEQRALTAPRAVTLTIDCRAPGHAISPYIYGVAGDGDQWELGATARRWGGNPTTRYNWQANALNVGKDWFFENGKAGDYRAYIEASHSHGVITALTLPMIGWVAKDTSSSGFPVSVFGPQHASDPYRADAGDGMHKDGSLITPGPPTQTSVAAPPESIQRWVEAIRARDAERGARGVKLYILDNEPTLWSANHRDVHPEPVGYDELLDRTLRYGTAIRKADPEALIAGPAEWGWTSYFYSAKDTAAGVDARPDRRAHGDTPLLLWYLQRLREHEQKTGTRLLDVLDVHFYPQANGVYGQAADPATAALRLRATRALWDPNYRDESWINDAVRLLPRLKEWVAQNYPGLAISIGEYNFGAEQHISGGLALAEALGRFGQAGIDYAFYWLFPPKSSPAFWAFRAYRNFDGKGAHFLEQSVDTRVGQSGQSPAAAQEHGQSGQSPAAAQEQGQSGQSPAAAQEQGPSGQSPAAAQEQQQVSLFASRDASGKHLVAIALNLDPAKPADAKIELNGCAPLAARHKYTYTENGTSLKDEGSLQPPKLEERLAPYSINVFDITLK